MSYRFVALAIALASLAPAPRKAWSPARTPDGQPDLQGVWTNPTITPFERPAELAAKPVLSEEEAAALEKKAAANRVDRVFHRPVVTKLGSRALGLRRDRRSGERRGPER